MLRKIITKIRRIRSYAPILSNSGKLKFIALDTLGIRKEVDIQVDSWRITVRTATPDIKVVLASLGEKEYADIDVAAPKLIIDAGANIGTSAIYFATKYPRSTVISLEPEEENFRLLLRNTAAFPNVKAIKAAIWGSLGERAIRNRNTGPWGYTVSDTDDSSEELGQQTNCITVDSIIQDEGVEEVDILKLDIEGGEKDVLENSERWISNVRVLAVELHDRICMGCSRAFYLATKNFSAFEKHGEKVIAYRDANP